MLNSLTNAVWRLAGSVLRNLCIKSFVLKYNLLIINLLQLWQRIAYFRQKHSLVSYTLLIEGVL